MSRRGEFRGGAYGDFSPEPVDIDLSDKVTDHPFYPQDPSLGFHDPNLPQSTTCLGPGCGRRVNEHRAIHMPPTREGYETMLRAVEEAKSGRRSAKEKEARYSQENDEAMQGPHGIAKHKMSGRGWTDKGPSNINQLHDHLVNHHDLDPDDLEHMEHHARSHALWHAEGDDDDHTHG